jgi:hypothetical protein
MPWTEVFSSLSPCPVAAASLGQVYRGRLLSNGEEVAVKVRACLLVELTNKRIADKQKVQQMKWAEGLRPCCATQCHGVSAALVLGFRRQSSPAAFTVRCKYMQPDVRDKHYLLPASRRCSAQVWWKQSGGTPTSSET